MTKRLRETHPQLEYQLPAPVAPRNRWLQWPLRSWHDGNENGDTTGTIPIEWPQKQGKMMKDVTEFPTFEKRRER